MTNDVKAAGSLSDDPLWRPVERLFDGNWVQHVIDVLDLYPKWAEIMFIDEIWRLNVTVDYKSRQRLEDQARRLAETFHAWARQRGAGNGSLVVMLNDQDRSDNQTASFFTRLDFEFDGDALCVIENVQPRSPLNFACIVSIVVEAPERPENGRSSLLRHPPRVAQRWRYALHLPLVARPGPGLGATWVCHHRFVGKRKRLKLRDDVAAWCKDHVGPVLLVPEATTLYFRTEADRMAFRLRWSDEL